MLPAATSRTQNFTLLYSNTASDEATHKPVASCADALQFVYATLRPDSRFFESPKDLAEAHNLCLAHKMAPSRLEAVVYDLVAPCFGMAREPLGPQERRLGLGCLIGLKVGVSQPVALGLVDKARRQDMGAIANHVALKIATAAADCCMPDSLVVGQRGPEVLPGGSTSGSQRAAEALYRKDQLILAGIRGDITLLAGMRTRR